MEKRKIRCTKKQIGALVEYMNGHPLFASGEYRTLYGSQAYPSEWERLSARLNSIGPIKPVNAWARTWRDIKKKARLEQDNNRINGEAIGETSERVLKILKHASKLKRERDSTLAVKYEGDSQRSPSASASEPDPDSPIKSNDPLSLLSITCSDAETTVKRTVTSPPSDNPSPARSPTPLKRSRRAPSRSVTPRYLPVPSRSPSPRLRRRSRNARPGLIRRHPDKLPLGPSSKMFADLQKQTNSLLQKLIDEMKNSNALKHAHNELLHRQNYILEENRSYRQAEKETQTIRENVRTLITNTDNPPQIRINKQKLLTKEQFEALMNNSNQNEEQFYTVVESNET